MNGLDCGAIFDGGNAVVRQADGSLRFRVYIEVIALIVEDRVPLHFGLRSFPLSVENVDSVPVPSARASIELQSAARHGHYPCLDVVAEDRVLHCPGCGFRSIGVTDRQGWSWLSWMRAMQLRLGLGSWRSWMSAVPAAKKMPSFLALTTSQLGLGLDLLGFHPLGR